MAAAPGRGNPLRGESQHWLGYDSMVLGPEARKQMAALGGVATIGIEMAVSICVGYFGGRWLDGKFGTGPWLERIGFVFGVVAGYRSLYRLARQTQQKLKDDGNPPE